MSYKRKIGDNHRLRKLQWMGEEYLIDELKDEKTLGTDGEKSSEQVLFIVVVQVVVDGEYVLSVQDAVHYYGITSGADVQFGIAAVAKQILHLFEAAAHTETNTYYTVSGRLP